MSIENINPSDYFSARAALVVYVGLCFVWAIIVWFFRTFGRPDAFVPEDENNDTSAFGPDSGIPRHPMRALFDIFIYTVLRIVKAYLELFDLALLHPWFPVWALQGLIGLLLQIAGAWFFLSGIWGPLGLFGIPLVITLHILRKSKRFDASSIRWGNQPSETLGYFMGILLVFLFLCIALSVIRKDEDLAVISYFGFGLLFGLFIQKKRREPNAWLTGTVLGLVLTPPIAWFGSLILWDLRRKPG